MRERTFNAYSSISLRMTGFPLNFPLHFDDLVHAGMLEKDVIVSFSTRDDMNKTIRMSITGKTFLGAVERRCHEVCNSAQ